VRSDAEPTSFDPERLRLARESKGWTKQRVAEAVGVTPAAVSQYENGRSRPGSQVVAKLALALGVPQEYFWSGRQTAAADSDSAHFRSLRSTTLRERRQALAEATLTWELFHMLVRYVRLPNVTLPSAVLPEPASTDDIESLAAEVRGVLGVEPGPVPNMLRLLEAHGAVVVRLGVENRKVDAFSCVLRGRPIVLLNSDKDDKARSRHDAAHELGHLVAHDDVDPGSQRVERQADAFAAAFLMPAEEIGPVLPRRLDWQRLIELRMYWGVSIASLLYRAHQLGLLSEHSYRRGFTTLNTRTNPDGTSWRRREPGDLGQPEQAALLKKAVEIVDEDGLLIEDLANELCVPVARIEALVGGDERRDIDL